MIKAQSLAPEMAEFLPKDPQCNGQHRYFVATKAAVEATGELHVIVVCTSCGLAQLKSFKVAPPHSPLSIEESQ